MKPNAVAENSTQGPVLEELVGEATGVAEGVGPGDGVIVSSSGNPWYLPSGMISGNHLCPSEVVSETRA